MIDFRSDYVEGCHPSILSLLEETNLIQTPGYGTDTYCNQAACMIKETFACPDADVHFVVGGTQANTTVIASVLRPYEGALCAVSGHINQHETGAIESSGHKVLPLPSKDGTITAEQVRAAVALQGNDEHIVKPGMVYISMSTEIGTLYGRKQLQALYQACNECGLYLFIDGARLGYALASSANDIAIQDLAGLCDVFTVGGTKQGALFGEAIIIMNPALKKDFRYMIKQRGGMLAKGRLLGLQYIALMRDGLYFSLAKQADALAMEIRSALFEKGIPMLVDSPTNQLFPIFTTTQLETFGEDFAFSDWETIDSNRKAVRIVTSWATTRMNADKLIDRIRHL